MTTPQRLPIVNSDDGSWGAIIRQFLMKEHVNNDTDSPNNGGHQNVTIQPGSATAAPLTFNSGPLLTTPAAGAMEFNYNSLYFTTTAGPTRKKLAMYDDTTSAAGDIYYRDSGGNIVPLPIGTGSQRLAISSGLPAWLDPDLTLPIKAIAADYTVTNTDCIILINAASNNVTATLPSASTVAGQRYRFKRTDAATTTVTLQPNGTDTIDGYTTATLGQQYASVAIVAAGGNWYII